jgi:hypothetical protein
MPSDVTLFGALFLGLAPLLLLLRFLWRIPPWWLIVLLILVIGWGAFLLTTISAAEAQWELVRTTRNPDPELLERASSDGGPLAFALVFGWLIPLVYAAMCWLVLGLAVAVRSGLRRLRRTTP